MARLTVICGLDIGSSTIHVVVAKKKENGTLSFLGAIESPSFGMRRGMVIHNEDLNRAIHEAIQRAKQVSGCQIASVYVSISGTHITGRYLKGVVSVSRADQEVSREDIMRVLMQVKSLAVPPNKSIIHVIPREYILDGEVGIHDPIGMRGLRLEVNALIIEGSTASLRVMMKSIETIGLSIDGIMVTPYAAAYTALSARQKELGVILLDIGGTESSIAIFNEGVLIHIAFLPIGSAHITNDIAIGLQIDIDLAEIIKIRYGVCKSAGIPKKEMLHIAEDDALRHIDNISRKEVVEIIEARIEELFELIDKELKKVSPHILFPAGIIITGGGAHMEGISEFARDYLHLPAHVGILYTTPDINGPYAIPLYATAVGLCLAGIEEKNKEDYYDRWGIRTKRWFQSFLP